MEKIQIKRYTFQANLVNGDSETLNYIPEVFLNQEKKLQQDGFKIPPNMFLESSTEGIFINTKHILRVQNIKDEVLSEEEYKVEENDKELLVLDAKDQIRMKVIKE